MDPLRHAIGAAAEAQDVSSQARARWLLGVCLNALGSYGQALTELTNACAEPTAPSEYRSLSAGAVASMFRQIGRHPDARDWDRAALEIASGSPEAQFDAWLGLASDAVGLGDSDQAFVAIAQSEPLVAARPLWWRQRIRLDWVRAEVSMLRGDIATAQLAARRALEAAEAAGAPRHVAKSLLFCGLASAQIGQAASAIDELARAAALAQGLGALPLVWPSCAVLGALLDGHSPDEAQRHLAAARSAIRTISDDLPAELATAWLARPDVVAILS